MKEYISQAEAEAFLEEFPADLPPHMEENTEAFPLFDPPIPNPVDGSPSKPSTLVREIMHLIGEEEPKRIIDLGAGMSATGLYLAAYGHEVTVVDEHPQALDWQTHWKYQLGLQNDMRVVGNDVHSAISTGDKYDLVIAEHLIHFMDEQSSRKLLAGMRAATLLGGFNIVAAYSHDNPDEEKQPPRNLRQFFSVDDLRAAYPEDEWETVFAAETYAHRFVPRIKRQVLIPSAAEIIVRKTDEKPAPLLGISNDLMGQYTYFS